MFLKLVRKFIPSKNQREVGRIGAHVERINSLEPSFEALSDAELRAKTDEFRARLADGESMEDLLCEAFAAVREASRRTTQLRHFDVQLIGGAALHEGKIAEMKTGEGKTLVATLPVYLNGLTGEGVHIITVNDYLARRDAEWMGPIYHALGFSVGAVQHEMDDASRQAAYQADVTYGTNNGFGFDYLRDNMKFSRQEMVQRKLHYVIVDEVDSILVDESRTPLIISGPAEASTDKYYLIDQIIPRLLKQQTGPVDEEEEEEKTTSEREAISKIKYEYLTVDEKSRTVSLNERGMPEAEQALRKSGLLNSGGLFDLDNMDVQHHVNQALKAHVLFVGDVDYVVKDGQVIIVDEFTGRLMPGRRYSDGLHQALEAKERVKIENENQTLATITFQNYFRMYDKLAGMTGTADTEAAEFAQIYNLDVIVIPTNRPLTRYNSPDVIYRTEREKYNAAVEELAELHEKRRPVLVGTISIDKSEKLSKLLERRGIPHHVLNAKHHPKEAEIVAQAGRLGAITISTNMAGRGTDILLGGNPEYLARQSAGGDTETPEYQKALEKYRAQCQKEHDEVVRLEGLHIFGTERHESRRIDNQLRGRAGRQGDPGSSRFFLSLEDDLLRIFGSDRISGLMGKLGMQEGEPIEHGLVTKAIENAQKKVETHHFEIRKHLLEYDDVMNKQREVIYDQRCQIIDAENPREVLFEMIGDVLEKLIGTHVNPDVHPDEWDLQGFAEALSRHFSLQIELKGSMMAINAEDRWINLEEISPEELGEHLLSTLQAVYDAKEAEMGAEGLRFIERLIMLQVVDTQWKDHLLAMDHLKEGIGFRGYAQKNPLNEYKREGYEMFMAMVDRIREEAPAYLLKFRPASREERTPVARPRTQQRMFEHRGSEVAVATQPKEAPKVQTLRRQGRKIGRNESCPCGSGKKYKHCCGQSV